jgi:hypothetical protein
MSKAQTGWRGTAVLIVAGFATALGGSSFAQDTTGAPAIPPSPAVPPPAVYQTENQVFYAPQYTPQYARSRCGGPYKGFYPCNGRTPYYGGACNVYGDAPIYTAPADYGYHHAAWCP